MCFIKARGAAVLSLKLSSIPLPRALHEYVNPSAELSVRTRYFQLLCCVFAKCAYSVTLRRVHLALPRFLLRGNAYPSSPTSIYLRREFVIGNYAISSAPEKMQSSSITKSKLFFVTRATFFGTSRAIFPPFFPLRRRRRFARIALCTCKKKKLHCEGKNLERRNFQYLTGGNKKMLFASHRKKSSIFAFSENRTIRRCVTHRLMCVG